MSLDSQLPPDDRDEEYAVEVSRASVDTSNISASIIGHGSFAGLGAVVGSFYGFETWGNGGGNGDLLNGMFYGAVIAGFFSLSFLKYRFKQ